jgi:NAD(P)-dependent dehydrogenase (short-subunit alcohol dehydrogenase family)
MDSLSGKTAVVTGGASGIGLGITQALAAAGARIALLDVEHAALLAAADPLADAISIVVDVSDRTAMYEAAERVRSTFGDVDVLVNNAGVVYNRTPLWDTSDRDIDWSIAVNLLGVFNGVKAFVPSMVGRARGGHIINTSSIGGFQVRHSSIMHQTLYAATKYAVTAISEGLRVDLAEHGIGVSVLAPASVKSKIGCSDRNRPERFGGPSSGSQSDEMTAVIDEHGMDPSTVGQRVTAAILNNEPYIFTHPQERGLVEARHQRIAEGFDLAERYLETNS